MMRVLLYGGSFDPPHIAHVRLPFDAMKMLGFDKVLYVPTFLSPLKETPHASDTHRLAMLKLALTDCDWAEISTLELERGGTSYTIDTVESLQKDDCEFRLLVGGDQWAKFKQWKRWEDLLRLTNPVILPREGFDICDKRLLKIESHPGISTDIRKLLKEGKDIEGIVSSEVKEYITEHQLYL